MSNNKVDSSQSQAIRDEIAELEKRLKHAKARLKGCGSQERTTTPPARFLHNHGMYGTCFSLKCRRLTFSRLLLYLSKPFSFPPIWLGFASGVFCFQQRSRVISCAHTAEVVLPRILGLVPLFVCIHHLTIRPCCSPWSEQPDRTRWHAGCGDHLHRRSSSFGRSGPGSSFHMGSVLQLRITARVLSGRGWGIERVYCPPTFKSLSNQL